MSKEQLVLKHSKNIDEYSKYISLLEALLDSYRITKDASPLINFRDALAHYVKLYESTEPDSIYGNSYAIDEHLNRGAKDIIVYFSIVLRDRIEKFQNSVQYRFRSNLEKFRIIKALNELGNLNLDIRTNFGHFNSVEIDDYIRRLEIILKQLDDLIKDWEIPESFFKR